MRVLYLTNIHNPYRDEFFEQLGSRIDLTVLFENRRASNRDESWFATKGGSSYGQLFLAEGPTRYLPKVFGETLVGWDVVIVGCYNTVWQVLATEYMRSKRICYIISSDGLVFDSGNQLKNTIKARVLKGAPAYLIAGEKCVPSLRRVVGDGARVQAYPFTSLTARTVEKLNSLRGGRDSNLVLSVGQYEDYKGIDVLVEAAAQMPGKRFRIVGMGHKKDSLDWLINSKGLANVETVAFEPPEELAKEYQRASLFVLPSRQECWGLVINEAAAAGCPIVSTWGSGAAIEFLSDSHPELLARPGDQESLVRAMTRAFAMTRDEMSHYSDLLRLKSAGYTIEAMVDAHLRLLDDLVRR